MDFLFVCCLFVFHIRVVTILPCLVASLRGFVDDLSKGGTKITLVIAL